ncbi:MAG: chloramphenicol acetyltransferase [Candidatus Sericytochromatia bacterium]|nr:chloramphenicol acetyltransferase [Candidatus Sericytochromatia bacterium]
MKYIDLNNWRRKKHFDFFNQLTYPHFSLCANVDITNLYKFIKENNLSFFKVILYICVRTANNIEEFCQRIIENDVVQFEQINPSFTVSTEQEDLFSFCNVEYTENFYEFIKRSTQRMLEVETKTYIPDKPEANNLIYLTSIPWVSFTSISHPINLNPTDSVPRIAWGKFFKENDRLKMPLSVQVHHALMDGKHVGKFFIGFQELSDNPEKILI